MREIGPDPGNSSERQKMLAGRLYDPVDADRLRAGRADLYAAASAQRRAAPATGIRQACGNRIGCVRRRHRADPAGRANRISHGDRRRKRRDAGYSRRRVRRRQPLSCHPSDRGCLTRVSSHSSPRGADRSGENAGSAGVTAGRLRLRAPLLRCRSVCGSRRTQRRYLLEP
jgi:hypothetical protein